MADLSASLIVIISPGCKKEAFKELSKIENNATKKWSLIDTLIIHRYGKLIVNELTERWVRLCFDEEYNFQVWQFSPELNIVMEQTGVILIPFHDIATMWGRHISEQKKNTGELNLHTLPNTVITGSKFLVVGPDSKYYLAGNNEEE